MDPERIALDIRPRIPVHEPLVPAEDAFVAAITTNLRRRVMVADAIELDDQPRGEVHVVGSLIPWTRTLFASGLGVFVCSQ